MQRRTYMKAMLAGAGSSGMQAAKGDQGIRLFVDLAVEPAKEKEMLHNFHTVFRPAASKQPGYIDVKMLKLRAAFMGPAPADINYRFELAFESEELRQKWIASAVHQKVWPMIESSLKWKAYIPLLFDVTQG
jgi:hypothetical protein